MPLRGTFVGGLYRGGITECVACKMNNDLPHNSTTLMPAEISLPPEIPSGHAEVAAQAFKVFDAPWSVHYASLMLRMKLSFKSLHHVNTHFSHHSVSSL